MAKAVKRTKVAKPAKIPESPKSPKQGKARTTQTKTKTTMVKKAAAKTEPQKTKPTSKSTGSRSTSPNTCTKLEVPGSSSSSSSSKAFQEAYQKLMSSTKFKDDPKDQSKESMQSVQKPKRGIKVDTDSDIVKSSARARIKMSKTKAQIATATTSDIVSAGDPMSLPAMFQKILKTQKEQPRTPPVGTTYGFTSASEWGSPSGPSPQPPPMLSKHDASSAVAGLALPEPNLEPEPKVLDMEPTKATFSGWDRFKVPFDKPVLSSDGKRSSSSAQMPEKQTDIKSYFTGSDSNPKSQTEHPGVGAADAMAVDPVGEAVGEALSPPPLPSQSASQPSPASHHPGNGGCTSAEGDQTGQGGASGGNFGGNKVASAPAPSAPASNPKLYLDPLTAGSPFPRIPPQRKVKSVEDAFNWPRHFFERLSKAVPFPEQVLGFLRQHFAHHMTYSSIFSGVDAPGTSLHIIAEALKMYGDDGAGTCGGGDDEGAGEGAPTGPKHLWAVEWLPASQAELLAMPHAPRCLFSDVSCLWKPAVRSTIDSLQKDGITLTKDLLFPLIRSDGACAERAWCSVHEQQCPLPQADCCLFRFPCVSWSPQGPRSRDSGRDFPHWSAAVAHRRKTQEKMLCYECSHMYDPQMMESVLGDLYLHFHRILDPLTQGQPVTRKRLWGIMLKKSSLAEWSFGMSLKGGWPHSRMDIMLSRLLSLFNRKCEVPFHAFLLATEDEIMWDCEWMRSRPTSSAKNRPQTTAEIFAHEGGVAFLSEYEKANLKNYHKVLVKKFGKAFAPRAACQLNQSADDWPMHSKVSGSMEYLHTMIKNVGVLFCKDRGITVNEMALLQGIPMYKHLAVPGKNLRVHSFAKPLDDEPEDAKRQWEELQQRRSRSAMAGQVGNSMHVGTCGSVLLSAMVMVWMMPGFWAE